MARTPVRAIPPHLPNLSISYIPPIPPSFHGTAPLSSL